MVSATIEYAQARLIGDPLCKRPLRRQSHGVCCTSCNFQGLYGMTVPLILKERHMNTLWWIIGLSLLGSAGVVGGVGILLLLREGVWHRLISYLVSFAVGTLLGGALLGLLPEALESAKSLPVFSTVLAGLVIFFILEKWVLWRHCHDPECPRDRVAGELILLGDAVHNFFDGIVIAASFLSALTRSRRFWTIACSGLSSRMRFCFSPPPC